MCGAGYARKKRGSRSRKILSEDGTISCLKIKEMQKTQKLTAEPSRQKGAVTEGFGKWAGDSERVIEGRHAQFEELGRTNPEDIRDRSGAG